MGNRVAPPVAALTLLWALVYLPHLLTDSTLPARDLGATYAPWQEVWREQVRKGFAPIWDPYSNHGRLAWADPDVMAVYPGTILLSLLPLEAAVAWHVALHHLLYILGCFHLARRAGATPGAAAIGAAAAGTCGVAFSTTLFLPHPAALAWTPWALASAARRPESQTQALRHALCGGILLGLVFLAGDPIAAGLAAASWITVAFALWPPQHWWGTLAAAAVSLAFAAPLLVPLAFVFPDTVRGAIGVSPGLLSVDTLAPRRFPELLLPHLLGPPLGDGHTGFWAAASFPWQRYYPTIFLGSTSLMALPFARTGKRELRPWWFLFTGGVMGSLLLSLMTVEVLAQQLPLVRSARYGIKLLFPATLALSPLVAAGCEALQDRRRRAARRVATVVLAASVAGALMAVRPGFLLRPLLRALYPQSSVDLDRTTDADLRKGMFTDAFALGIPPGLVLAVGPTPIALAAATFIANALAANDVLAWDSRTTWAQPPRLVDELPPGATIAVFVTGAKPATHPGLAVLTRFWSPRAALLPNYGVRWGVRYVLDDGPNGLEPVRHELLAAAASRLSVPEKARVAAALGAQAVISDVRIPGWASRQVEGVWVNVTDNFAPPAYLATRVITANEIGAAARVMASGSFRPGADAVVEGSNKEWRSGGGTAHEGSGSPSHLLYDVTSDGPGLLVIQQSYMRCWQATVDGRLVPVGPVNGASIGVLVPAGHHDVVVFIDPTPYRLGLVGPLLVTLTVFATWLAVFRRRGRSNDGRPQTPA